MLTESTAFGEGRVNFIKNNLLACRSKSEGKSSPVCAFDIVEQRLLSLKLAFYFLSKKIILFNFSFQYVFVNLYTSSVNAEIYTVWSETCNSSI